MQKGRFIISLDFELMWGVRDKRTLESYGRNIRGVRKVIPSLLELFEKYDVHATFATVGFLFARTKDELLAFQPKHKPGYHVAKYSPYENYYLDSIGQSELDDIYHYAASLIRMIQQLPTQEIASHTFSHFYCLENASLQSFEEDLLSAKAIASSYAIDLKSIVFPRNQYSEEHIQICKKLGFTSYRGNPISKLYDPRKNEDQSQLIRAGRLVDSFFNLTGHHAFKAQNENGIVNVPASRFLRPYSPGLQIIEGLKLKRIKNDMSYAARTGESYHLWWHPHNFGTHLHENLAFLEEILKHYQQLYKNWGMESRTMKAIAEEILVPHGV